MVDFQCKKRYSYEDLLHIMALLRSPGGCPWDREQTHASLRRNFLEESCEVVEAIDRGDSAGLCEELGDALLQVVFHAQLETEQGGFTMEDVVDGICKKLVYRHPHVFGSEHVENSSEELDRWETLKRAEKGQQSAADAVDAVARTLPALWRAEKIQSKAAKAGFDWPSGDGAIQKLEEEAGELRRALADPSCSPDGPHGVRRKRETSCLSRPKLPRTMALIRRRRSMPPVINSHAASALWRATPPRRWISSLKRTSFPCGSGPSNPSLNSGGAALRK